MKRKIDMENLKGLPTFNERLDQEYGPLGTPERDKFEAETIAWYEQVCSEPDEGEVMERRWPRLKLFGNSALRRVAAM